MGLGTSATHLPLYCRFRRSEPLTEGGACSHRTSGERPVATPSWLLRSRILQRSRWACIRGGRSMSAPAIKSPHYARDGRKGDKSRTVGVPAACPSHDSEAQRLSVRRFVGAATVHLLDAIDGRGALRHDIKAIDPASSGFAGSALPCHAGADDTLAILAAFALAQPGDVVVGATEGFRGSAVVGDLFAGMAKTTGVVAIVTDGLARGSEGIAKIGVPVFAGGISPNSAARSGPGTVGLPVTISGVHIAPGDVMVGDRDGVVVVQQSSSTACTSGSRRCARQKPPIPLGRTAK